MEHAHHILLEWLQPAAQHGASDLHLRGQSCPYVRISGKTYAMGARVINEHEVQAMCEAILEGRPELTAHLEKAGSVDLSMSMPGSLRVRANIYRHYGGMGISLRFIPLRVPELGSLGLPEAVSYMARATRGLILITGPVNSGKSTTVAAMVDHANRTRQCHILTLEDPIEFVHSNNQSMVTQQEVRREGPNFTDGLRMALRQDPDLIVIGEIRDEDSAHAALAAAEAGQLVITTMHSLSVHEAFIHLDSYFMPEAQKNVRSVLAESLVGIVSQRLTIQNTGGLAVAAEVLVEAPGVSEAIRNPGDTGRLYDLMTDGSYIGMQTLDQALCFQVASGAISVDEAFRHVGDRQRLKLKLESFGVDPGRVRNRGDADALPPEEPGPVPGLARAAIPVPAPVPSTPQQEQPAA